MTTQLCLHSNRPFTSTWRRTGAYILTCLPLVLPTPVHAQDRKLNGIDYSMYFLADVRDNEHCAMTVSKDGNWSIDARITNPAMTCPDMTSWRLFATVVRDKFWSDWADETQNWPEQPWALCSATVTTNCCTPNSSKNDLNHCPIFPGDASRTPTAAAEAATLPLRIGRPSITHELQMRTPAEVDKLLLDLNKSRRVTALAATAQCPASVVKQLVPSTYESIGRVARQTNSEITIRNRAFHEYLFANNLYNADGLVAIFSANDANQKANAPYAAESYSAGPGRPGKLSKIDFPSDAIMIKSNWLYEGIAQQLGIGNTAEAPFITQRMTTVVQYPNGAPTVNCNLTGTHYLMSFHISSKDIPNWVWTTFEHIMMPGRCDFIGCNDSYGYSSTDKLPAGVARNFVAPHVKSDNLLMAPSSVFDRDKLYPPEKINPGLDQVLKTLGIGTAPSKNKDQASIGDTGWRSYRLKGSQVEFTNSMGRKTQLGNSITEAGFMSGVSCISCHARAGIHVEAKQPNFLRLSVFDKTLSEYGYALSVHGVPNPNWYYHDNGVGTLDVLQGDFVWGFFNANAIVSGL